MVVSAFLFVLKLCTLRFPFLALLVVVVRVVVVVVVVVGGFAFQLYHISIAHLTFCEFLLI